MISLVIGLVAGIGIDSALTLLGIHVIRRSQNDLVAKASENLRDQIVEAAPEIFAEVLKSQLQ